MLDLGKKVNTYNFFYAIGKLMIIGWIISVAPFPWENTSEAHYNINYLTYHLTL